MKNFITDIGKNSLGIYLVHKIIIVLIENYIKEQTLIIKLILPIIVLLVSYIIVKIIKKIPIIRKVVQL